MAGIEADQWGWRLREHGKSVPVIDPLLAFDKKLGDVVERLVRSHHRRRLRRRGWERALDAQGDRLWADGDPPPREGNAIEVLVDGAEALPRIAAELRKARSHVHIAGWYVSPWFDLEHDGTGLATLLAGLAARVDVRVLVWAGSPLPLFRPDREDVDGVRHAITFGSDVRFVADPKERPMHCHHEKLVVIDDRVAFVGGIDLTTYEGDRWDSRDHVARGRLGWHDAAVMLRGPIVADVADDTRGQLADLLECDGGADRVLACTLTALGDRGPCPIYVHAKIGIVDDRWFTLGSANLNEHSLFNDTEVNVVCCEPGLARRTRLRLWSEHLERTEEEVSGDATPAGVR